ncbi:MAG: mandelate racemase/muconate lactonizing enzyme family protein [Chloroflexi bacterium]|nr:mandelate racemase/muconate lactonizing enzyme family protein [Chloroflexota bacterium]
MHITSVTAYAVRYPQQYLFGRPAAAGARYFLRPGFPTVYSVDNEALLVRIETDSGLVGWGEALAPVAAEAVALLIASLLRPLLIGEDPADVEVIWHRLYGAMRVRGHQAGLYLDAVAAIDIALWDLFGHLTGQPVARLLGGRQRERLGVYHSGVPGATPAERAEAAVALAAEGYRGVKLHLGHGVTEDVATVAAIRAAAGPELAIMLDGHWAYTVKEALAIGRQIERHEAAFFEAPIAPEDTTGHAALAAALTVPIAIGEGERTRWQFLSLLQARALDIAQPDIGRTGLSEGRRIAHLCETFNVPVAPHVSTGLGIRYAATLHYAAALPTFLVLEHQGALLPAINASLTTPIAIERGEVAVPTGPGLGVTLNEAALRPYWTEFGG